MTDRHGIRKLLEELFREALAAVDPVAAVRGAVARDGADVSIAGEVLPRDARLVVLAVGKAAGGMACALEDIVGQRISAGLAVVPDASELSLERIAVREAAHPIPDERCERAGVEALELVASARPDDVLIALISGGASSLLSCPAEGVSLGDLAGTTAALLEGGAAIDELNAVRKHLSRVAGGRLAACATSDRIEALLISDVPGDRLDVIGSGPFVGDPTTYADALHAVARRTRRAIAARALAYLEAGARGELAETPSPDTKGMARVRSHVLASNATAIGAAAAAAVQSGIHAVTLGGALRGEARDAGRRLVALGETLRTSGPTCVIAGGETAVAVRGCGRGGRNQELALAAALAIEGRDGLAVLGVGTDGIDGPTDAAGAFADGETVARGRALGLDAQAALDANDSHSFFSKEGGILRSGPTGTNVMDLAFLYIAR